MKSLLLLLAWPVTVLADLAGADVVFLGEIHDNPAHHAEQAALIGQISPAAVVFEMLTPDQAAKVTPALLADRQALREALDWDRSGWPDFDIYYPVFAVLGSAKVYGAGVPREAARAAMDGLAEAFGPGAARFGLDRPLPEDQQAARESLQMAAHCDALPPGMLPAMVGVQRLRDARLAQVALQALDDTGGPVAVITGNGHARRDWGAPALLLRAAPEVTVHAIGQGEGLDMPEGSFDALRSAPPAVRDDPCAVFRAAPPPDTADTAD